MNVFDLEAVLRLNSDNFTSGLSNAANTIGGFVGTATRLGGAAITAAAAGVTAITTASVNAYGEYEQLWGGVQKLYGAAGMTLEQYAESVGSTTDEVEDHYNELITAQNLMAENAANAWQSSGMSASAYMDTATQVAATLINSVGGDTEEAARITDVMMRDISDNFNTFGGDIEAIRNAYMGFSRDNYTMLDNLKLGYAGTAQGMIDLINDSGILEEQIDNLNEVSFDQMIMAIHTVQENMQIAGTTAREAAGTIQGSLGSLKAAWQNLMTGLADPDADIGPMIDNVVEAATNAINNIIPAATRAIEGIGQLIEDIAPVLADTIPQLVDDLLPPLLSAISTIVSSLADNLPQIVSTLTDVLSNNIIPALIDVVPAIIRAGIQLISALGRALIDNASEITDAILEVLDTMITTFSEAVDGDGISNLVDTAMTIIEKFGQFLIENAPMLITAAVELITQLALMLTEPSNLQMMIELSLQLIMAIADGLVQAAPQLGGAVVAVIGNLLIALWNELPNILMSIGTLLGEIFVMVANLIGGFLFGTEADFASSVDAILNGSIEDFRQGFLLFVNDVIDFASDMWTGILDFFTGGILGIGNALNGWWEEIVSFFADLASNAVTWASDMIDNFVDGLMGGISRVGNAVSGIADEVRAYLGFSEPEQGPLSNFHTFAPDMIDLWNETLENSIPSMDASLNRMSDYVASNMPTPELDSSSGAVHGGNNDSGENDDPGRPIVVQAYFGNEKFDEYVVDSNQRNDYISGGRG